MVFKQATDICREGVIVTPADSMNNLDERKLALVTQIHGDDNSDNKCQHNHDTYVPTQESLDWSFVDRVFLITCPDASSERLEKVQTLLYQLGLWNRVEVKTFKVDEEDRVRGCYTSHLSVMRDAWNDLKKDGEESNMLILEDNMAINNAAELRPTIQALADFSRVNKSWDILQLFYIPFVPNFFISRTDYDTNIIQLHTDEGSSLGTTAYVINTRALAKMLQEDDKKGYYTSIPSIMSSLFPHSRYSVFPTPLVRSPSTKSLVNSQLDYTRAILFQPRIVTMVQHMMILLGWSSNTFFFIGAAIVLSLTMVAAKLIYISF